jgi:hypothetical protein
MLPLVPGDSELYCDIRQRVRKEVFEGREHRGWHRQGSELAAAAVLCFAAVCYTIYARYTGWMSGLLLGGWSVWCRQLDLRQPGRASGGFFQKFSFISSEQHDASKLCMDLPCDCRCS